MPKIRILGVEIDNYTKTEVHSLVNSFLHDNLSHFLVTVNPEIILEGQTSEKYRQILNSSSLALADGFGLKLASLYLGQKLKARITGMELIDLICRSALKNNQSLYLLGALDRIAEKAAINLQKKYPGLKIAGTENGFRFWGIRLPDSILVRKINRARPQVLLVAFGAPKQEAWLAKHLKDLKTVRVAVGVGGAFDFLSGQVKRAPAIMRKMGLEWLWRLILQPWRYKRIYNATFRFCYQVIKNKNEAK